MKPTSRKLMLSKVWSENYQRCFPIARLKGLWLTEFGFHVGDQVTVTSPEPHTLIMRVTKSAEEFRQEKLAPANEESKNHQSPL